MKKSKLFVLAISMPMLFASITGCASKHQMKHENFIKDQELEFLYDVTYNDYSWNDVTNWMNSDAENNGGASFGCSSIHNGNYYGRSFDFCLTDMCEFLVRTKHENGHFASIGVAIGDCKMNQESVERIIDGKSATKKDKLNEKLLPFTMVDGINENGVVCNTNVVPAKDLIPHEGEDKYFTHGTNPDKPDLFYQFMPRFILDNAKSAYHAVELLKERNLTAMNKKGKQRDYLGVSKMGYELHCMIADRNDTYIVEMVDDRLNILHSNASIMTNFYLSDAGSPSGAGFERYMILSDGYETVKTLEDMEKLIHEVKYSPCYNPNWEGADEFKCPIWPTEFAGCDILDPIEQKTRKLTFYNAELWFRENWDDSDLKASLLNAYNIASSKTPREQEPGGSVPWISTHAEVYDIDNRTLYLTTQEKEKDIGGGEMQYDFKAFEL